MTRAQYGDRRTVNQLAQIVGQYERQLQNQLSHSDKLQAYIKQKQTFSTEIQEKFVKLKSERYALYEYIHQMKYPTKPFSIHNLKKELGLDSLHETDHVISQNKRVQHQITLDTLQNENITLTQNLTKLLDCSEDLSKQLINGIQTHQNPIYPLSTNNMSHQKHINKLKNALKTANEKASIYKNKLKILQKLRAENRLQITNSDQVQESKSNLDDLHSQIIALDQERKALKCMNDEKQSELENKIKQTEALQNEYYQIVLKNADYEKQIDLVKDNGMKQQKHLIEENSKLKSAYSDLRNEINHLRQKSVNELQQKHCEYTENLSQIQKELEGNKKKCQQLNDKLQGHEQFNEKTSKLEKQHNDNIHHELEKYKLLNNEFVENEKEWIHAIKTEKEKINKLEREKKLLHKQLETYKLSATEREQLQLEKQSQTKEKNLKSSIILTSAGHKDKTDEIDHYKDEMENIIQKQDKLLIQLNESMNVNDELKKRIIELNNDKMQLQKQIETNVSELKQKSEIITNKENNFKMEINKLQKNIKDKTSETQILIKENKTLNGANNELKKQTDSFKMQRKMEINELELNNENSQKVNSERMVKINKYKNLVDMLQKKVNELEEETVDKLQHEIEYRQSRVTILKQKIAYLQTANEQKVKEYERINANQKELQNKTIKNIQKNEMKSEKKIKILTEEIARNKSEMKLQLISSENRQKAMKQKVAELDKIIKCKDVEYEHNEINTQSLILKLRKYNRFTKHLCNILQCKDESNLVELVNIFQNRLRFYRIMNKSCDFLLDIMNDPSLDLNVATNSLTKITMKYDIASLDNGTNIIEMDMPMSLVTNVMFQMLATDNYNNETEQLTVCIKLFYKLPWNKEIQWIGVHGTEKEKTITINTASLRDLRLYPCFTEKIKLEISCVDTKMKQTNIKRKISVNIVGKKLNFN